jgi:hypothetical protein
MGLFCNQFLKIGKTPCVEITGRDGRHDGTPFIPIVATVAEATARGDSDDILEHVQYSFFTRWQLKFANSRIVHEHSTTGQQMERT